MKRIVAILVFGVWYTISAHAANCVTFSNKYKCFSGNENTAFLVKIMKSAGETPSYQMQVSRSSQTEEYRILANGKETKVDGGSPGYKKFRSADCDPDSLTVRTREVALQSDAQTLRVENYKTLAGGRAIGYSLTTTITSSGSNPVSATESLFCTVQH